MVGGVVRSLKLQAIFFASALLTGLLVAWTPRYWGVSIAVASVSLVSALWALTAREVRLPAQTVLVLPICGWAAMQLAAHSTIVRWPTILSGMAWAMGGSCFILGSQILRDRRSRKQFLDLMLRAVTGLAVAAMLQMYLTPGKLFGLLPVGDTVVGTLFYKNQFAALMELTAPIALWKVYHGRMVTGGLCFAAMFAATISSASRTGVLLVLAELAVFIVLMIAARRTPLKYSLPLAGMLGVLVLGASLVAGTEQIWNRFQEQSPYALRGMLVQSTLKMMPLHPWFGSGLGTWPALYPGFATFDSGIYVNEAHNDWAQWTIEGGIPFIVLLAALVIWLTPAAVRSVWGLGVMSVMIHSFVDYPLREPVLLFFWFVLAGALTQVTKISAGRSKPARRARSEPSAAERRLLAGA